MDEFLKTIEQIPLVVKAFGTAVTTILVGWVGFSTAKNRAQKQEAAAAEATTKVVQEEAKQTLIQAEIEDDNDRAEAWREVARQFKDEITELMEQHKTEISELKSQHKSETQELKEEIAKMRQEMRELEKRFQTEQRSHLAVVTKLEAAESTIAHLQTQLTELKSK